MSLGIRNFSALLPYSATSARHERTGSIYFLPRFAEGRPGDRRYRQRSFPSQYRRDARAHHRVSNVRELGGLSLGVPALLVGCAGTSRGPRSSIGEQMECFREYPDSIRAVVG